MRKSCGSLSKVHFAHPFLSSVGQREKCLRRNHGCHQKWNYEWNQQFQEHVVPVAPKHIFAIQCLIQAVILCSRHIFPPCDRKVRQSRPQGSRLTQSATMPGCQPDLTWEKPESQFWGSTYLYITSSRKITNNVVLQPISWKVTSTMGPGVKPEKRGLSLWPNLIWHLRETWEPVLGLHLSVPNSLQTAHGHLSVHPCNFPHLSTLFRNVECLVAPQRYLIWTEHLLDVSLHETCIFLNRTYLNN